MSSQTFINDLLKKGTSETLAFLKDVETTEIGRVICSFLNHDGGQLLIGVSADKMIVGIKDAEQQKLALEHFLQAEIIPEAAIMVAVELVDAREILIVKVWAGPKKPYIFDDDIFVRRSDKTAKASSNDLSELIHQRQKSEVHWEKQPAVGVKLEDIDLDEVKATFSRSDASEKSVSSKKNILETLSEFGLYENGSFTNAALICFGKSPERYIPQSRVRLSFMEKGKTADTFIDDQFLGGNLFKNLISIEDFLNKHLRKTSRFEDSKWTRTDSYPIPLQALREGIVNALVHRDYASVSASVSIIIYSDRIEITNTGKSPLAAKELTKSHISIPPNPYIAHMVFLRGYMEKIGRGTLKIVEACKEAGLKSPQWKIDGSSVKLTFYADIKIDGATDGATDGAVDGGNEHVDGGAIDGAIDGATKALKRKLAKLLHAIVTNEGKRTPDYKQLTKLGSERTMERYIQQLRDVNLIEYKGDSTQTGGYFLTKKLKKILNQ